MNKDTPDPSDSDQSEALGALEALRKFKYEYNDEEELVYALFILFYSRHIETGEKFKFTDQAEYDKLTDVIIAYVQQMLVSKHGLVRHLVPIEGTPAYSDGCATSPIYASEDIFSNGDTLLVLLQGSGRVRAGIWGCALCVNDTLKTGAMFEYIKLARERNWAVIVPNPNQRYAPSGERVNGSTTHEEHTGYVWEHFVEKSPAKNVLVVAHSYAGISMVSLAANHISWVLNRVRAIAFTDSVHNPEDIFTKLSKEGQTFFATKCVNWVRSTEPLDAVLRGVCDSKEFDKAAKKVKRTARLDLHLSTVAGRHAPIKELSAGTTSHPLTNSMAMNSIFEMFDNILGKKGKGKGKEGEDRC